MIGLVRLAVGVVADHVVVLGGGDPERQPEVPALARLAVQAAIGQQGAEAVAAAPEQLDREVVAREPLADVGDAFGTGPQGDHHGRGVDRLEAGEGALGGGRAGLPLGDRDDHGRLARRRVWGAAREVVEGRHAVLRVVHPSAPLSGQPGKAPGYAALRPGVRPARYSAPTPRTTAASPTASPRKTVA